MLKRLSVLLPGSMLLALSSAALGAGTPDAVHTYQVAVTPALDELAVEARLSGNVGSLQARELSAHRYLRRPRLCDGHRLQVRQNTLPLPDRENACVRYEVDLRALAQRRAYQRGSAGLLDRLTSPAAWLWQPAVPATTELRVNFDLPAGVKVSVPWQPVGDHVENAYRIGPSPESSNAMVIFGGFDYRQLEIPGATLRISLLRSQQAVNNDHIVAWLLAAADNVVGVSGRFPNPSPQVVVVPLPGYAGQSAVPFGRVIRDGGEAIQFFVAGDRPLAEYLGDWTATHEFSHLLLPYVDRKWISEGFASYHQNVLMARGGFYSQQRAWQKLHEGFGRGRRASPDASPNQASGRRSGLLKVYWSGAAVALLADVALRTAATPQTLDAVLGRLQSCCLPSQRTWGGRELFAHLDKLAGAAVFAPLYDGYANTASFPPVELLYPDLGIELIGGQVTLNDRAPLAAVRRQIMSGRDAAPFQAHREDP